MPETVLSKPMRCVAGGHRDVVRVQGGHPATGRGSAAEFVAGGGVWIAGPVAVPADELRRRHEPLRRRQARPALR